jgi:hypothetical protein
LTPTTAANTGVVAGICVAFALGSNWNPCFMEDSYSLTLLMLGQVKNKSNRKVL